MKRKLILIPLILLSAIGIAGFLFMRSLTNAPMPAPLSTFAVLPLKDATNAPVTFQALHKPGIPTVVSFWTSWCGPCKLEAAELAKLRQAYGEDKMNIIYINADEKDDLSKINAFLSQAKAENLKYVRGSQDVFSKISQQNVMLLPRTYVFDRGGNAVAAFSGYDENGITPLRNAIDGVLKKP